MSRGTTLVVAVLVGFATFGGDKPAKVGKGKGNKAKAAAPAEAVIAGDAGAKLEALCTSKTRFPDGLTGCVLVARDGKVLLRNGYGVLDAKNALPMRPDALFDWCSVSKQFTAAAVLKLQMQKKLSIDDPIAKHFKDVPKDKAKVTVRHLLNHTSGIGHREGFGRAESTSKDALVRWFLGGPVVSPPGEKFEYSNAAYFVLAALIENESGKSWERFLRDELFVPAGMADTWCVGDAGLDLARVALDARGTGEAFEYGPVLSWGYRGAGGVVAPVADLLAWDRALRGNKLLSEAVKREYYAVGKDGYALGWEVSQVDGATIYAHSGRTGQLVTYYLRSVDPDVVVAVALNEEPPPIHPGSLARELLEIARDAGR